MDGIVGNGYPRGDLVSRPPNRRTDTDLSNNKRRLFIRACAVGLCFGTTFTTHVAFSSNHNSLLCNMVNLSPRLLKSYFYFGKYPYSLGLLSAISDVFFSCHSVVPAESANVLLVGSAALDISLCLLDSYIELRKKSIESSRPNLPFISQLRRTLDPANYQDALKILGLTEETARSMEAIQERYEYQLQTLAQAKLDKAGNYLKNEFEIQKQRFSEALATVKSRVEQS